MDDEFDRNLERCSILALVFASDKAKVGERSYMEYSTLFARGVPYEEFLRTYGTDEQRRRWQQFHDSVRLTDLQRELLRGFRRQMRVVCLAGAWCGDCVQQCPIFEQFGRVTETIQVRYLDRDTQPDVTAALSICGGARVPVVVFLSEEDKPVGWYGDRTLAKYRQLAKDQLGASCPTGMVLPPAELTAAVVYDWLNEFERVQLLLRLSGRLRQKHGD